MGGIVEPVVEPPLVIASILGTAGNDTLTGTIGSDTITGLAGNDVLFGGGGGDSLYGDAGDDYLVYRVGDRLFGGAGIDTVYFDLSARGAGVELNNVTVGSPFVGFETLAGKLTAFNDTLFAGALGGPDASGPSDAYSGASVYAGAGQDSLVLNYSSLAVTERVVIVTSGSNIIAGRVEGSTRLGSANLYDFEAVTLRGSLGDDYMDLSGWTGGKMLQLFGGAGDDSLRAGAADSNLLYGGDGNDELTAKSGNGVADRLYGGGGNDAFWFVTGQDQIFGGAGVDEVILDLSASNAGVSIGKILDAEYSDVENYYGMLTNYADTVRLIWAATAFGGGSGQLDAGAGNDTLVLDFGHITALGYSAVSSIGTGVGSNFGVDLFGANGVRSDNLTYVGFEHITLLGSAGNDSLRGVDLAETLRGRDGDDWITGGRLGDLLDGGAGNDTLQGDAYGKLGGADTLYGGAGDDVLSGELGNDLLFGGDGNDEISSGTTIITDHFDESKSYGGNGDDTLFGWGGADLLSGGNGNDSIDASNGTDTVIGGFGNDWLSGGAGADLVTGADGNDTLHGDASDGMSGGISAYDGSDSLYGGAGNDALAGDGGLDLLYGGLGNDSLRGGDDDDIMSGGAGVDRFIFELNYGFPFSESANHDTITDYTAGEVISFANFVTTNLSDLTITQNGADMLISWSDGSVTLLKYSGAVAFAFDVDQPFL